MTSTGTPAVSRACRTPRCARPRDPPPLRTSPTALPAIHRASRAMSCAVNMQHRPGRRRDPCRDSRTGWERLGQHSGGAMCAQAGQQNVRKRQVTVSHAKGLDSGQASLHSAPCRWRGGCGGGAGAAAVAAATTWCPSGRRPSRAAAPAPPACGRTWHIGTVMIARPSSSVCNALIAAAAQVICWLS